MYDRVEVESSTREREGVCDYKKLLLDMRGGVAGRIEKERDDQVENTRMCCAYYNQILRFHVRMSSFIPQHIFSFH